MRICKTIKLAIVVFSSVLPFYAYSADITNDVNEGVSKITSKAGDAMQDASENMKDAASSVGDATKDTAITTKIKGKITQLSNNKQIGDDDLHVETTNGVVHIFGKVSKSNDVDIIKTEVSKVNGVKDINTNIDVME